MALEASGQPEDALGMISRAVENRRHNRPGTRYLAQMIEDQALVEIDLGQYKHAAHLLEEAAAIRQAVGAPLDVNHQNPQIRLSLALGNTDEAAVLVDRYYGAIPESAPLSPEMLRKLDYLAQIALLRGDGPATVALAGRFVEAIAGSPERAYLEGKQATAMFEKAKGYLLEKDPANALPLLERVVHTNAALLDAHAPDLALAEAVLGTCYLDLGDRGRAESLFSQSQAILRTHKYLGETYRKPVQELARRLSGRTHRQSSSL
jgi:hypothetical protein